MKEGVSVNPSTFPSDLNSDGEEYEQIETFSTSSSQENSDCGTLDIQQNVPQFGNISVINSSEVHFGTKTVYQGPVTIKQFLYNNGNDSNVSDVNVIHSVENGNIKCNGNSGIDNEAYLSDDINNVENNANKFVQERIPISISKGCPHNLLQHKLIITLSFSSFFMIFLSILLVVLVWKPTPTPIQNVKNEIRIDSDETDNSIPRDSPRENITLTHKLRIVLRQEWLAQPPTGDTTPLSTPVPLVIIMHSATDNCSTQAQCTFHVRHIQMFHIESRGWYDIGYNFLVGGDGSAYEGRGWKTQGAHTYGFNSKSIGIAFVGTFSKYKPPPQQIDACMKLIAKGVELGYISKNYKVLAVRQLQSTESPGAAFFEDIKTWPHWSATP